MPLKPENSPIKVLLVEDNPGDIRLTRDAIRESGLNCDVHVLRDGAEAILYLKREGKYAGVQPPELIILDWNLPKRNGMEVLREIKGQEELRMIPVIILTSSESQRDIEQAYHNFANCYITKPLDHEDYSGVIKAIQNFWLSVAKLPSATV